ncbi:2621_t:CDS:2 [Ambispora gerdemannii]|uniref:2621_t:CDS:1 n=1 Tax=Ambispora gerdemannii TaxID=144530 RepID=A0A9N8Z2A3_9GLOM|nr:2621_t:CDS:2 [Ambispora gerdemannii]
MSEKAPEFSLGATTTTAKVTPLAPPPLHVSEATAENGSGEILHEYVSKKQNKNSSKMDTITTSASSISLSSTAQIVVKKEVTSDVITTDEIEIDHLTIPVVNNNNGRKTSSSFLLADVSTGSPDSDAKNIGGSSQASRSSSSSASNSSRSSSPTTNTIKEIATTTIINPKRGRGRPRKSDTTNESDNHSQSAVKQTMVMFDLNDDSNDNSAPRKRGRPPKDSTPFAQFATAAAGLPKKRGRPPKSFGSSSMSSGVNLPKRRGRPPKSTISTTTSNTNHGGTGRKRGRPRKEETISRNRERKTGSSSSYIPNPDGWTAEEDRTLVDSVLESLAVPPWTEIAKRVQNHDASKCFNRWTSLKRRLYRDGDE